MYFVTRSWIESMSSLRVVLAALDEVEEVVAVGGVVVGGGADPEELDLHPEAEVVACPRTWSR